MRLSKELLLICLAATALAVGCGLDVVEIEVEEEGFVGMGSLQLPGLASFGNAISGELGSRNINPADVDSLRAISGTVAMTSQGGLTADLAFFKRLRFLAQAQGLDSGLLAESPQIAAGQKSIHLVVSTELELKPYLAAGNFKVAVDALLDPLPPDRVDLKIAFRLRVDVNL